MISALGFPGNNCRVSLVPDGHWQTPMRVVRDDADLDVLAGRDVAPFARPVKAYGAMVPDRLRRLPVKVPPRESP